ncbi:ABC transporter ATP-binding protein/permease [Thiovibrio frasassiensis]|uniref:ATP-binding cassette domain-containing protein n=1 Tax=Thiovibrio frasassiensis TaxID=2984131 RepID=A0A9X4MEM0_9BACT|nr:SbmA/BacA-like family transporter [Thiovibrio frasassiensis]MDG4474835.1 ATP-binding cassette domain-containing protein [Thiovibrio frasassiensis]
MPKSLDFLVEFLRLSKLFWSSKQKLKIRGTTFLLALLTVMQMILAVVVTQWSAALFNALEQHSMRGLITQIGVLAIIFVADMAVTGSHLAIKRNLQIYWRDWLTDHVISRWMHDGRHYLISHLPGEHDNPDGRIAEDCRVASESAVALGHSLFYCILLLIGFSQVLWARSGVVTLEVGAWQLPIYGHLVWIAVIYTALASWLGWRVSLPLTAATNARQSAEADFRASLLEAQENSQAIALIHANSYERHLFRELFCKLRTVWNTQTTAWRNIQIFSTGYASLNMAFPILISAPRYILGMISLGAMMQAAQAFQQMVGALSWPVGNVGGIAEWRASVERVLSLLKVLDNVDEQLARPDHWIQVRNSERPVLALRNLSIAKYEGPTLTKNINMEIGEGEHVLITGNPYTGAKLFRAIAGVRPWGSGVIELPSQGRLFFMPPRPHLPTGSLRNAICYPTSRRVFSQEQLEQALRLVGLEHLIDQLDQQDNWTHTLARGEQQLLGMVRLLLNRPQWIFLQEAFDSLDPREEERMLRLISEQLPDSTLLAISHLPNGEAFYARRLAL